MLPVYLGIYIFILAVVWGFFLVARHHTLKFKYFSTFITPVTFILTIFLFVCSILGFFLVFTLDDFQKNVSIDKEEVDFSEIIY